MASLSFSHWVKVCWVTNGRDIDADGIGGNGAQDEVFLGAAFELDMNGKAV